MRGKLFLGTARFLQNRPDEAAYRSAVSRAYYACFLEARQVAFDNCSLRARRKAGIPTVGEIGHKPLQVYLKHASTETIKQLGEELAGLHGSRRDADYNMTATVTVEDARGAVEDAEAFLCALSEVPPTDVGKAMEQDIDETYSQ